MLFLSWSRSFPFKNKLMKAHIVVAKLFPRFIKKKKELFPWVTTMKLAYYHSFNHLQQPH